MTKAKAVRLLGIPLPLLIALIIVGLYLQTLTWKQVIVISLIAISAAVLILLFGWPFVLFYSVLALLDIVLIFMMALSRMQIR